MTIEVGPTIQHPTHHIRLVDVDSNEIGLLVGQAVDRLDPKLLSRSAVDRTGMKISQGNTEYGDLQLPYYAMKQDDFSGGRGARDFEKDTTRYSDMGGLNSRRPGFLHLGGQEQFAGLLRNGGQTQPGSILNIDDTQPGDTDITEWCVKIVPAASGSYGEIWIYSFIDASQNIIIKLYDGAGAPFETPLANGEETHNVPMQLSPGWTPLILQTAQTVNNTDGVWVSISFANQSQYRYVARDTALSGYKLKNGSAVADYGFPVRLLARVTPEFGRYFEYKHQLYYVQMIAGTVHLWMNGYRGTLTAGGTGTATLTGANWPANGLAGGIFYVIGGTGINEVRRWRKILSNTTDTITFISGDGYTAALAAGTEFVVLGSNKWTEITGHGITRVRDLWVCSNGVVYFSQGYGTNIRTMREYTNAGAWTRAFADDGTNQANFMVEVGAKLWRAQNATGGVSYATTPAAGVAATFGADIPCGDPTSPFTGLEAYIDEAGTEALFVLKEETAGPIVDLSTFKPIRIDIKAVRSENNGRAHLVYNGNLYFSLGNGLEQYYYPLVDDVGPNRDEGLPANRRGPVVSMRGYAGRFFIGIDAGTAGFSSVLSSGGWHEEFRAPYGCRLFDTYVQPIPGTDLDRLWVAYGGDVNWVPLPSEPGGNPLNDTNYRYCPGGYIETASMFTDMKTILKWISKVKLFLEGATDIYQAYYKVDDGTWIILYDATGVGSSAINPPTLDSKILTYDLVTVALSGTPVEPTAYYGLECHSVQFRIELRTENNAQTPIVRALVMELLARIDTKYVYSIPFVIKDNAKDLNGTDDDTPDANDKLDQLLEWAGGGPLYMESVDPRLDQKMVWMIPNIERVVSVDEQSKERIYIGEITVQDA